MNRIFKTILLTQILMSAIATPAYADEACDDAIADGKAAYNSGNYSTAQKHFENVVKWCGGSYGAANSWIQNCKNKQEETKRAQEQKRQEQKNREQQAQLERKGYMEITDIKFANIKKDGTIIDDVGESLYSDAIRYLKPSVYYNGLVREEKTIEYDYKIINPNGILETSDSAHSGFSTGPGNRIRIKPGYNNSVWLMGLGNDNKSTYTSGTYKFELWYNGNKLYETNFKIISRTVTTSTTPNSPNSTSTPSSATLSLSKTSITASATGTTEYITVTSNCNWEIQYPSASMYTVTKLSDTSIKVVINRNTGDSRQNYFYIKTTDGSKTVKVNLSQSQGSSSSSNSSYSSSSYRYHSRYRPTYNGYSALSDFNSYHGKWEIDWLSTRITIGTGTDIEMSAFAFRFSVLKIEPGIIGIRYDFLEKYLGFYYQPDLKLIFPWNSNCAVYFGAGPSINVKIGNQGYNYYDYYGYSYSKDYSTYPKVWFTAEFGILYHWGNICSSDFFIRYDKIISVGVSLNLCSGF